MKITARELLHATIVSLAGFALAAIIVRQVPALSAYLPATGPKP